MTIRLFLPWTFGLATPALAVAIAATFASASSRGLGELPAFFVWSLPLGIAVALYSRRARFASLPGFAQTTIAAVLGLAMGIGFTMLGWALIGGWMLAWNFPVLYCWSIAAVLGLLGVTIARHAARWRDAIASGVLAFLPLALLWHIGSRPMPAVLIIYRDTSAFDAAQFVLDSLLSAPHPSGTGRDIRWPTTTYARVGTPLGETAALIGLERQADRDSIRALLAGHPLVKQVIDTTIRR